jgi:predicted nucleotidyltransferase
VFAAFAVAFECGDGAVGDRLLAPRASDDGNTRISLVLNNGYITDNPEFAMLPLIAEHRAEIAALCRRFGVRRLAVFGSAARGADFDPQRSDVDFLVEFAAQDGDFARFGDFKEALEALLARRVDLVDRKAIEASRNYIRKRHILTGAEPVYAA